MANLTPTAQYTNVGTVGSVVLTTGDGHALYRVVIPGTYVGTVNIFDSSTIAGTSASNQIISLPIPNTNVGGNIELGLRVRNGITYAATGTPSVLIVWE